MPIGDLLAQISGGDDGPSPGPAPSLPRANTLPKRKADEDLRLSTSKTPRTTTLSSTVAPRAEAVRPRPFETSAPPSRSSQPTRPLDRPAASQRPTNGSSSKPSVLSSRPLNGGNRVQKPAAPSRPSPGPSSAPLGPRSAPKKGSFAEILARGQRAQAVMGQVGKIQHKKVAKGPTPGPVKKEEPKVDSRTPNKKLPQRPLAGYSGTSKPLQRNGTPVNGGSKDGRNGKALPSRPDRAKAAAAVEEQKDKRVKKAAVATTGYTGTARPKPGSTVKKHNSQRGGALLNTRAPRPNASKSRFDDEYDEELDDFIDYDDEEDEDGGPRYDYASDESSDMEAGMDDIDHEERRAEVIARREDIEEERLERSLKAAKEDRKRKALDALRAGRRR